jgi:hypothetical protein
MFLKEFKQTAHGVRITIKRDNNPTITAQLPQLPTPLEQLTTRFNEEFDNYFQGETVITAAKYSGNDVQENFLNLNLNFIHNNKEIPTRVTKIPFSRIGAADETEGTTFEGLNDGVKGQLQWLNKMITTWEEMSAWLEENWMAVINPDAKQLSLFAKDTPPNEAAG